MLTILDKDRRVLTAGLLRVLKVSASLSAVCLAPTRPESSWVATMTSSAVNAKPLWDGNVPFCIVQASIARTAEAAANTEWRSSSWLVRNGRFPFLSRR